ncbi:MAG: aldehyde dehydrogenase family protein [Pyrinomonadaceae bacterium]
MAQARNAISKDIKSAKNQKNSSTVTTRKPSVKTFHNYINGEWKPSVSRETFENRNPADTRDIIGRFPLSTAEDVGHAVASARAAADKWRRTPAPRRAEILFRLGELLMRRKSEYAHSMTREMGKVLKETGGDVQEAIDCTVLHRGRRAKAAWLYDSRRDARQICDVRAPAGRLVRIDHALEFSYGYSVLEADPGANLRQHRGDQARGRHSAFVSQLGESMRRGRSAARSGEFGQRLRTNRRSGAHQSQAPCALISFTGSTETGRVVASACAERNAICSLGDGRQECGSS